MKLFEYFLYLYDEIMIFNLNSVISVLWVKKEK